MTVRRYEEIRRRLAEGRGLRRWLVRSRNRFILIRSAARSGAGAPAPRTNVLRRPRGFEVALGGGQSRQSTPATAKFRLCRDKDGDCQ